MTTYGKGSRVEATFQGKVVLGIVTKGGAATINVRLDDGRDIKGAVAHFRPSTAPAPVYSGPEWKKGMRVEFETKREGTVHATVDRVSAPFMHATGDGGQYQYKIPFDIARPSTKPLPKDEPSPMDDWSVVNYKAHPTMSEETICFEGQIAYKGVVVLQAKNTGKGGCNFYYGDRKFQDRLAADAKDWCERFGYANPYEADDTWLTWAATGKKYGQLASDYLKVYAEIDSPSPKP